MQAKVFRSARPVAALPLAAILLGSVALASGRAATAMDAAVLPAQALPAVVAVAAAPPPAPLLPPPAPPPADIRVIVSGETTGSVPTGAWRGAARAVPAALAFDDGGAPARPARVATLPEAVAARAASPLAVPPLPDVPPPAVEASLATAAPASTAASALAPTPSEPARPVVPATANVPSSPAVPAAVSATGPAAGPAQGPVIDGSATPSAPQTLDAAALAAALPAFVDERVAGDTPVQAAERHRIRDTVATFYAAHADLPLWLIDAHLTPAARSVLARLDHAAEDGLDMHRFAVPVPRTTDLTAQVKGELALSEAAVTYGRQASGSRVDIAKLGGVIDLRPAVADADRILSSVPAAGDAGEALHALNPPQPGYAALREKLAELRATATPEARDTIPNGPVLKPGMRDARVPLIRARFGLDVASVVPGVPPLVYDTKVAAAVAEFQRAHGLPASGLLTPITVAALSGGNPVALENTIIANMEMWRWQPRETAPDRIEVNIPEYRARVFRDGAMVHDARVVVGQPTKQTPVFNEQMRFIIVNPYWNVPLSIIKTEMMPKLAADPNYFANHGYEVVERDGVRYVRQPPGDGNALGRIKFMFPNTHSVYLHDTNARSFFGRDMRALSHGCVRVDQPFAFAEAVMGRDNGWPESRIRKMIGGQERTINLPRPLPILITYFTASVDPAKGFELRDDIYGYAGGVKTALNLHD